MLVKTRSGQNSGIGVSIALWAEDSDGEGDGLRRTHRICPGRVQRHGRPLVRELLLWIRVALLEKLREERTLALALGHLVLDEGVGSLGYVGEFGAPLFGRLFESCAGEPFW